MQLGMLGRASKFEKRRHEIHDGRKLAIYRTVVGKRFVMEDEQNIWPCGFRPLRANRWRRCGETGTDEE